jgi:hypothetical protein
MIDTPDINIATFIVAVKRIKSKGHYYKGDQLRIKFDIPPEKFEEYTGDYINSDVALCDATRKNFLQLLKRKP